MISDGSKATSATSTTPAPQPPRQASGMPTRRSTRARTAEISSGSPIATMHSASRPWLVPPSSTGSRAYVPETQSRSRRSLITRRITGYAVRNAIGTTPHSSSVLNHSGWPASTVDPRAVRASHGGVTWSGAPGIGASTASQRASRRSYAGSRAGAARKPLPIRPRAATTLAATASTVTITTGLSRALLGRSSPRPAKSSPVSSSRDAASASPATDR